MSASRVRSCLLLMVCVLQLLPGAASAQTMTGVESRITSDPGDQYDPAISGNIVVFTDYRSSDTDVYYVDLPTMVEHRVIVAPGNQELTGVSNGRIVYTDYRTSDVVLFDTADGTTQNLTAADKERLGRLFNSIDPAISGNLVAWEDSRDGNMEIYAMDVVTDVVTGVVTGEERRITDALEVDARPAVSGTVIVWQRCAAGGTCDIWSYDWATGATTQITDTPSSNERSPRIDGQKVVYQTDSAGPGNSEICLYHLTTQAEQCLALAGDQANPHVSGDNVSFDDLASGLYHIGLWNLPTNKVFQVTSGTSGQYLNDIDGNRIVYTDDRNGDLEIYLFTFQIQMPSVDIQPPVISGAVDLTVNAVSPAGADVVFHVAATDNLDPSPILSCTPPSGSTFGIGDTLVTCTASDQSGNQSQASFSVHVRGADAQIVSLAKLLDSLNLKRGIELSLKAKLIVALVAERIGAVRAACNVLGAFINEVNAQTGKAIRAADAAALIAAARQICAVLGCL
jgi:TolB protein